VRRIVPHLWYDTEAGAAARLYASVFDGSKILGSTKFGGTPSGEVELVSAELSGLEFQFLSAGPYFKFTPAVSFLVACDTAAEVDRLWSALSPGGSELMPLGTYPFSERYSWLQDRYGLSWQVMLMGDIPYTQKITPTLMFTGAVCGKAEEAVRFYASVFSGGQVGGIERYAAGEGPDAPGTVKHADFTLEGKSFAAMDSAYDHGFTFNEAISFEVYCDTQAEIDYFWEKLSADPEAEQCGWLKDKYGLSWQIVPSVMDELMRTDDQAKIARVTEAFLKMKKFNIAELERSARP